MWEYLQLLFFTHRCPALLVVGDTSPAVEAVVSDTPSSQELKQLWEAFAVIYLFLSSILIPHWYSGGVQFQVKSYQDHTVKGEASCNTSVNEKKCFDCTKNFFMRLIIFSQMADCGGLPQVVQVGFCLLRNTSSHFSCLNQLLTFTLYLFTARETCWGLQVLCSGNGLQ